MYIHEPSEELSLDVLDQRNLAPVLEQNYFTKYKY